MRGIKDGLAMGRQRQSELNQTQCAFLNFFTLTLPSPYEGEGIKLQRMQYDFQGSFFPYCTHHPFSQPS